MRIIIDRRLTKFMIYLFFGFNIIVFRKRNHANERRIYLFMKD